MLPTKDVNTVSTDYIHQSVDSEASIVNEQQLMLGLFSGDPLIQDSRRLIDLHTSGLPLSLIRRCISSIKDGNLPELERLIDDLDCGEREALIDVLDCEDRNTLFGLFNEKEIASQTISNSKQNDQMFKDWDFAYQILQQSYCDGSSQNLILQLRSHPCFLSYKAELDQYCSLAEQLDKKKLLIDDCYENSCFSIQKFQVLISKMFSDLKVVMDGFQRYFDPTEPSDLLSAVLCSNYKLIGDSFFGGQDLNNISPYFDSEEDIYGHYQDQVIALYFSALDGCQFFSAISKIPEAFATYYGFIEHNHPAYSFVNDHLLSQFIDGAENVRKQRQASLIERGEQELWGERSDLKLTSVQTFSKLLAYWVADRSPIKSADQSFAGNQASDYLLDILLGAKKGFFQPEVFHFKGITASQYRHQLEGLTEKDMEMIGFDARRIFSDVLTAKLTPGPNLAKLLRKHICFNGYISEEKFNFLWFQQYRASRSVVDVSQQVSRNRVPSHRYRTQQELLREERIALCEAVSEVTPYRQDFVSLMKKYISIWSQRVGEKQTLNCSLRNLAKCLRVGTWPGNPDLNLRPEVLLGYFPLPNHVYLRSQSGNNHKSSLLFTEPDPDVVLVLSKQIADILLPVPSPRNRKPKWYSPQDRIELIEVSQEFLRRCNRLYLPHQSASVFHQALRATMDYFCYTPSLLSKYLGQVGENISAKRISSWLNADTPPDVQSFELLVHLPEFRYLSAFRMANLHNWLLNNGRSIRL